MVILGTGQLDAIRIAGVVAAGVLLVSGLWVLWAARHRETDQHVLMPIVGVVSVPTCLTAGISMMVLGYHAMVYSLPASLDLLAVPIDRWWILVVGIVIVAGLTAMAEWLEHRDSTTGKDHTEE